MEERGGIKVCHFQEGQKVSLPLLVEKKEVLARRDGSPYLSLTLRDGTGAVEARLWEFSPGDEALIQEGRVLNVKGEVRVYNGRIQLSLTEIQPSDLAVEDLRPQAPLSLGDLAREVGELVEEVEDSHCRALLDFFFSPERLGELLEFPGGKRVHHAYRGGLAHHLVTVARGSLKMASIYPHLDRDLLITGALLHDIGKIRELTWEGLTVEYTDEGRLLGHVALGLEMVAGALREMGFPSPRGEKILHIIASHHGEPEQGALKRPKIPEALVIYYMDQMDAKVSGFLSFVERDSREGNWTSYHRVFQRFIYKG